MDKSQFETMSQKEKINFIKTQNPKIICVHSVTEADKEIFGDYFYTYRLDNGWNWLKAHDSEELVQKFNYLTA